MVQGFKSNGVSEIEAVDSQRKRVVRFAHTGRAKEADIESLFHPGHVGQAEHLLSGDTALETEVEEIERFFCRQIGPFPAQKVLLGDTQRELSVFRTVSNSSPALAKTAWSVTWSGARVVSG